tara:strand:+ start:5530 stop:6228 length:699 start_codon:yes stop_codon:yes gene_type:complete
MKQVTIFLSTRNRPRLIKKTLDNIRQICPQHKVLVGNASSPRYFKEVSDIINSYNNTIQVSYSPDPGLSIVYTELYKKIDTELAVVWADDMEFLREFDSLLPRFDNPNIHLVALPMIDDISSAPITTGNGWPKDKYGCALWATSTGRCAHHAISRVSHFIQFGDVCGAGDPNDVIDNFCHYHTSPPQRFWPPGPYILHTRIDDETRLNTVLGEGRFRFPTKASFSTPGERDQ